MQGCLCSGGLGKTVKAYYPSITTTLYSQYPTKTVNLFTFGCY